MSETMTDDSPRLYRIQDVAGNSLSREFKPSTKISDVTKTLKPNVSSCLLRQGGTHPEMLDSNKTLGDYNIGPDDLLVLRQIQRSGSDPNPPSKRPASTPQKHESIPTPSSGRSILSEPVSANDTSALYKRLTDAGFDSELANRCCAMVVDGTIHTAQEAFTYCREMQEKETPFEPPPEMEPLPLEPEIALKDVRTLTRDEILEIRKCEPSQIKDIIDYIMDKYPGTYDIISRNKAVVAEVFGFDVSLFS